MFNPDQFKSLVSSVCSKLDLHSPAAVNLLLGTAAQESGFGTYLKQIKGPALGVFQMEPATETDIWKNYLSFRAGLACRVIQVAEVSGPNVLHLSGNLIYQIALCRVHYLRKPEPMPSADDLPGLARYWKAYYNTPLGRGTADEFIENYRRYVTMEQTV